jgi:hypothetical protein
MCKSNKESSYNSPSYESGDDPKDYIRIMEVVIAIGLLALIITASINQIIYEITCK